MPRNSLKVAKERFKQYLRGLKRYKEREIVLKQIAKECTDECLACLDNRSQGFVHSPDRALFACADRAGNSGDTAVLRKKG